jgi:hypothetical protein
MNIFRRRAAVRAAHQRVAAARGELDGAANLLLARSVAHPLLTVGVAAGAGVALAVRLFTEFGVAGLGAVERGATGHHAATSVPADGASP